MTKVVGLIGGIGAGKSAVARALADRGALVLDSDADAKLALDRPDVRATLEQWWGSDVISADGRIDRRAVAAIVFNAPEERRRLEAIIHPILKADRAKAVAAARARGVEVVVIDAPLLLEAGVDRECDAVLFVDAPREIRLARVKATRGWDEAELSRREAAQLPLAEKRARANSVIVNDGDQAALTARVDEWLRSL
jgi:dephospho-CoA kinase